MKIQTTQHVKFLRLKRSLGLRTWQAVGVLEAIWNVTVTSAPDGAIGALSNEDIAAMIEWDRDPDELVSALVSAGWLDQDEEHRLIVHDWSDHCPTFIKGNFAKHGKLFADQAAKQANRSKKSLQDMGSNLASRARGIAYSIQSNSIQASCPDPDGIETSSAAVIAIPDFPLREAGRSWGLPADKLDEWKTTWPDVHVERECLAARQWLRDHPERRKTARGMIAFLGSWIQRSINKNTGGASRTPPTPYKEPATTAKPANPTPDPPKGAIVDPARWEAAKTAIEKAHPGAAEWLKGSKLVAVADSGVWIEAVNEFARGWIVNTYRDAIAEAFGFDEGEGFVWVGAADEDAGDGDGEDDGDDDPFGVNANNQTHQVRSVRNGARQKNGVKISTGPS